LARGFHDGRTHIRCIRLAARSESASVAFAAAITAGRAALLIRWQYFGMVKGRGQEAAKNVS